MRLLLGPSSCRSLNPCTVRPLVGHDKSLLPYFSLAPGERLRNMPPMTATVDRPLPADAPRPWPLSVPAYHVLGETGLIPEKTELLYGCVYEKMPKSPLHRLLVMRLLRLLLSLVPAGFHVQPEQPITCGDSEPEPDLSVIRGGEEEYATHHPQTAELVIEVVVSSHEYDRSKLHAYASANVAECWLVLAPERQIEVYRQPNGDHYAEKLTFVIGQRLTSTALPSVTVEVAAVTA